MPGFCLHTALSACSEPLASHGGHAAAAGLKIEEGRLEEFRAQFCEYASTERAGAPRQAELRIDAEVPLGCLTTAAVSALERLAPFGHANPRPLLCATDMHVCEPPKRIGRGERHLSLRLAQHGVELRGVAFGGGAWADELTDLAGPIAVAFRPVINEFRGRRSVELQVCDWQPSLVATGGQRAVQSVE